MYRYRKQRRSSRTQTVTALIRAQNKRLIEVASQNAELPEIIDIPATDPNGKSKLNSSMYSGTDLHRSITAAVRGKTPLPEFAAIARRLLDWLRKNGATRIESELTLECSDVRGICDLFVRGVAFNHQGIVEVKACNELPNAPDSDDRLQLALYLHAASSLRPHNGQWGALVYCSLKSGSIRIYVWKAMQVHAQAVGLAIPVAT